MKPQRNFVPPQSPYRFRSREARDVLRTAGEITGALIAMLLMAVVVVAFAGIIFGVITAVVRLLGLS